eukprot:3215424-Rhodomonas_salina.1
MAFADLPPPGCVPTLATDEEDSGKEDCPIDSDAECTLSQPSLPDPLSHLPPPEPDPHAEEEEDRE